MLLLKPKRIKLAQTDEAFQAQADKFLTDYDFPVTDAYRTLFGSFVQHIDQEEDSFSPEALAKCIRKAVANEFAFYLIHPERRPKKEETKDEPAVEVAQFPEAKG